MKQHSYDQARELLERSAAADPDSPKVHYQLSLAYARLGRVERSEESLARYRRALGQLEEQAARLGAQGPPAEEEEPTTGGTGR
jgi:Tfp pilus assembly protein PilF